MLEHKTRPTAGLCALFALDTTPEALVRQICMLGMFRYPEGFVTMALDHHSASVDHQPAVPALLQGGLGGLLLRLRQEGHASLTVVGPQGAVSPYHPKLD